MTIRDIAKKIPGLVPIVRTVRDRIEVWRLANRPMEDVFQDIYRSNRWSSPESASGTGSDLSQTAALSRELPLLLRRHGVRSMLDIPCGDFNWMSRVDLAGVDYTGADIVPALVARNTASHARPGVRFMALNLATDPLPATDLVFVRDCLVHLSFDDVRAALRNVCDSGATWLLTTTFPGREVNRDIRTGQWRALNLQAAPFLLPVPVELFNEGCTEGGGAYADKSLGLWTTEQVRQALELNGSRSP